MINDNHFMYVLIKKRSRKYLIGSLVLFPCVFFFASCSHLNASVIAVIMILLRIEMAVLMMKKVCCYVNHGTESGQKEGKKWQGQGLRGGNIWHYRRYHHLFFYTITNIYGHICPFWGLRVKPSSTLRPDGWMINFPIFSEKKGRKCCSASFV